MAVPNTFATATSAIPLANLDANFAYYDAAFSITGAATTFSGAVTLTSNLTFTGTGNRITGDFSNATYANRVLFQTSTTNGVSSIGVIPNGTGLNASFFADSDSAATNSSRFAFQMLGGADARLSSTILGTGTYLPMTFYTGGSERMRLDTSGRVLVGSTSARANLFNGSFTAPLQVEGTTADNSTFLAVRNNDSAGAGPFYILARARGATVGSTTIVQSGDVVGGLSFQASDGTEFVETARIQSIVDGTPGANDMPGAILFSTTADGAAGSSERMRISSTGAVTIGNTSDNNTRVLTFNTVSGGSSSIQSITDGATNQALTFSTTYTTLQERMRIDGQGNVIVGGTSTLGSKFAVIGTASGSNNYIQITNPGIGTATIGLTAASSNVKVYNSYATGVLANGVGIDIDTSGNVGIGTSSPAEKLRVTSTGTNEIRSHSSSSGDARVGFWAEGAAYNYIQTVRSSGALSSFSDLITFNNASGTERMRIDSSGNLLVGQTAVGTQDLNSYSFNVSTGAIAQNHITGTGSGASYTVYAYAGTVIGSVTQSGTTAVLFNVTSDQRLKENIQDAESASALIDALQVRQFDWKTDNTHQRYGFIAQELVTVAPEAVHQPTDPEEMMAVDYSKLVPMLVKEIQFLRKRLADAGIA
jgi:hypothetical protein